MDFKIEIGKKYKLLMNNTRYVTILSKREIDSTIIWYGELNLSKVIAAYDEFGKCLYYIEADNKTRHLSSLSYFNIEGYFEESDEIANFCTNHEYVNVSFMEYPGDFRCKHCGKKKN